MPQGTVVYWVDEAGEREVAADLVSEGQRVCVVEGGKGGRGNIEFASPTNRVPLLAEVGEAGEGVALLLEVKLLADVGIVGKPNAGKSTLLGRITRARAKVAAYPFTTVEPVLGVIQLGHEDIVALEIPGLLEGAHRGVGLGHDFLRHIERTRALVHLVDGLEADARSALEQVRLEMREFKSSLVEKPFVIAVNKLDLHEVRQRRAVIEKALWAIGAPVFFISAATGEGVEPVVEAVFELVQQGKETAVEVGPGLVTGPRRRERRTGVNVVRECGTFRVEAPQAERLVGLADLRDWRVRLQLRQELTRLGVTRALEEAGVREGDTVILGGQAFQWE